MINIDNVIYDLYDMWNYFDSEINEPTGSPPVERLAKWKSTIDNAVELFKSHDPHVLSLDEIQSIGKTWDRNTPPYLWTEILDAPEWYTGGKMWVPYSFIHDTINIGSEKYNKDKYMKRWRCWNKKPTDDQRKNTPWEND